MKIMPLRTRLFAGAVLALLSSYSWACYVSTQCTCAVIGTCYGASVLPTCQVPTCIIADSAASVNSVCEGNGPYQGREVGGAASCCPYSCRIYDNCAHQYVTFYGSICCFTVARYYGTGSGCQ